MKKYSFLFFVIMSFLCVFQIPISASAETKISVDQIVTESTDLISVPIRIEGNTGMCGAALSIKYDKNLILTSIEKGEALPSLTLTKSAELSSNPQKLVWDGIDSDSTNGVIAKMYFKVPEKCGTYNVEISYEQGDIVDGNLQAIDVNVQNGYIMIEEKEENLAEISVGNVKAKIGIEIKVPINISDNPGICGAALSVSYDKSLKLSGISYGEALTSLTMTRPGNLLSNPIKIIWDGLEADNTNGSIAILSFITPNEAGEYNISVAYEQGDIVDGNLDPIKINTKSGTITVEEPQKINVNISGKQVLIGDNSNSDQKVIISYFDDQGLLKSIKTYPVADEIQDEANHDASFAKVMLWNSLTKMRPMCTTETVNLR